MSDFESLSQPLKDIIFSYTGLSGEAKYPTFGPELPEVIEHFELLYLFRQKFKQSWLTKHCFRINCDHWFGLGTDNPHYKLVRLMMLFEPLSSLGFDELVTDYIGMWMTSMIETDPVFPMMVIRSGLVKNAEAISDLIHLSGLTIEQFFCKYIKKSKFNSRQEIYKLAVGCFTARYKYLSRK